MSSSGRDPSIEAAAILLRRVQALRLQHGGTRPERIDKLLDDARKIDSTLREQRRSSAARLSFFDALGLGDDELAHSRFLAFLLDPGARHDQGAFFLKSFLARFGVARAANPPGLEAASVCVEFAVGQNRLDIVILLPNFGAVCIENKTWSGEGREQISRYQQWLASIPEGPKQLIFLTPDGRHASTAGTSNVPPTPISYADLAKWLLEQQGSVPEKLRHVLEMYADACLQLHASVKNGGTK
jgi:hypothetical protein